jgi:NADPH2:quinone reductase
MKAVQATRSGGPEVIAVVDLPEPAPGEGQVLVKVEVAGVNYADILSRRGVYPLAPPPPFVLGFEVAGSVAALGPKVSGLRVGDRVVGFTAGSAGGYAERALAPAAHLFPIPIGVGFEDAAAHFITYNTAYHCLKTRGRIQAGETVLIQAAAGAVGTAAIQLATQWGARVLACASSDEKLAKVKALGADVTINYAATDFVEAAKRATGGRGADVVLESVGGDVFDKSIQALAPAGRLVVFGAASGKPGTVQVPVLQRNNLTVATFSIKGTAAQHPEVLRAGALELLDLLAKGTIRPVIGKVYPLAEAAAAQQHIEGRGSYGKVLLTP